MMIIRLFARQTNMLNRNLNCGTRDFLVSGSQVCNRIPDHQIRRDI
ncbi:hypothetical protein [Ehrlichia ruminantium]|nr:hypothetical protein [Ehrlichia ruminantium]